MQCKYSLGGVHVQLLLVHLGNVCQIICTVAFWAKSWSSLMEGIILYALLHHLISDPLYDLFIDGGVEVPPSVFLKRALVFFF